MEAKDFMWIFFWMALIIASVFSKYNRKNKQ